MTQQCISLHKLIAAREWELALSRCESHPEEAKVWRGVPGLLHFEKTAEMLPIHSACAHGAPRTLLKALALANPIGIRTQEESHGRLPIHIACINSASLKVIKFLLRHHGDGAAVKDVHGKIPLHYASSAGAPRDVTFALLKFSPEGPSIVIDERGLRRTSILCCI